MLIGYIKLYTAWDGLRSLASTGSCLGKLLPSGGYKYEIVVPLSSTNISWDENEEPLESVKVDFRESNID